MAQSRELAKKAEQLKLNDTRINYYLKTEAICKLREAITNIPDRPDKQTDIAKKKPEESIPVILQILISIKSKLMAEPIVAEANHPLTDTLEIIENAITIFGETDRVQIEYAWNEKLNYIAGLLEEARPFGGCDVITVVPADKKKPLDKAIAHALPLISNAAFIRYGDQLYYFNREWHKFIDLKLNSKKLAQFDKAVTPQNVVKTLSAAEIKEAENITAQIHLGTSPFKHLHVLVQKVPDIRMTGSTVDLWEEAGVWLEGLYRKTADNINGRDPGTNEPIRGEDGIYPLSDIVEDRILRGKFGFTKMEVSIHYHRAAQILERLVEAFRLNPVKLQRQTSLQMSRPAQQAIPASSVSMPVLPMAQPGPEAEAAAAAAAEVVPVAAAVSRESVEGSIHCKIDVLPDTHDGFIPLVTYVPVDQAEFGQTILDMVREYFASPLVMSLRQFRMNNTDTDTLIEHFDNELRRFGLSIMQKGMLANFKDKAQGELNHYLNDLSWYNPIWLFGRGDGKSKLDKVNAALALEANKNLTNSTNVKEQIQIMIKLRRQLYEAHSNTLRPNITRLIMSVIERLCPIASLAELHRENSVTDLPVKAVKLNN